MWMGRVSDSIGPNGRKRSVTFSLIFLLGLVGLFTDMATEGTRSIIGPYLGMLGASAAVVSAVAGLSELVGYSLRIFFGRWADASGRYWAPMFIGYAINLVAVPALALAGNWPAAVGLIMVERIGRAMRCPARDAVLSHTGRNVGRGWAYGVQEALSSVGGMLGPTMVVGIMVLGGDYRLGLEILLVPALLTIVILSYAYQLDCGKSRPARVRRKNIGAERFPRIFWVYIGAGALIAAGYADFPLIALHVGTCAGITAGEVPILYALAMAANALSALIFGRLYDRMGIGPLIAISMVVPLFVPMVFSGDLGLVVMGMMLYGIGFGAQESMMRALVADMSPQGRVGSAFGLYNAAFGVTWFLGSVAMGVLYGISVEAMVALSMGLQFTAVPLLMMVRRGKQIPHPGGAGGPLPQA